MLNRFRQQLQAHLQNTLNDTYRSVKLPELELETPADKQHGELAANIALKSAKELKKAPIEIASELVELFEGAIQKEKELNDRIKRIEVKKPGFINFFLTPHALHDVLVQIFQEKERFGQSDLGQDKKVQIEFVSANPTGPLSVAHARQAAVGDALGNILKAVGCDVTKEYYVNDEGNQINLLGASVRIRAEEIFTKRPAPEGILTKDHYQGDYIIEIAKQYIKDKNVKSENQLKDKEEEIAQYAVDHLIRVIKKDLEDFGVHFDVWSHQSKIATRDEIEGILAYLGEKGFMDEKDGALWFKSTDFGDDKDRVLQKSNGEYTYLTPDIVYHKDKFERGFEQVINIWGPDHHGYIPRLTAAVEALGQERKALKVLIVQLATIYRDGKELSMSTRRGEFISLREVLDEVGADAARFFFLMRHISVHLDFDLTLAKEESPENPVYYVQYAHARVYSINKKAKEAGVKIEEKNFDELKEEEELDLIKKIGYFPDCLETCYQQLDPYALVNYLHELAAMFHKFYDKHRVIGDDKILSAQRLGLVNATRIVIANGLTLLGVSAPQQM